MPSIIKNTQTTFFKKAQKGNPGVKSQAEIQRIVDKQLAGLPMLAKNVVVSSMTQKPIITTPPNFA